MVKCGFCHVSGHNRRSCEKIYTLCEAGPSVKSNTTIDDFADFFSKDSDFAPDYSDSSPSSPEAESEVPALVDDDQPEKTAAWRGTE